MSKPSNAPMLTFRVVYGPHRDPETNIIEPETASEYFVEAQSARVVRFALEQVLEHKAPGTAWAMNQLNPSACATLLLTWGPPTNN